MNCSQYRELLSPYLDGALGSTQRRNLENHLALCNSCREELEALRQTVKLLQAWSEEELDLPDGFEERLRERLRQACQPWYRHLPKGWLSLAAAAAIMVGVAVSAYAGYIYSPLPFQARQVSLPPGGEVGEQLRLEAPATPEPVTSFSGIVTDQAGKAPAPVITFFPENASPAQAPADKTAKTTESQPVVNGRERMTAAQTNKVNFRGQKLDPALNETQQLKEETGKLEEGAAAIKAPEAGLTAPSAGPPDNTPPVPQTGKYKSAPAGTGRLPEKEAEPGASDREQTVPEKVYGKLKLPEGDWQQATETGITAP